MSSRYVRLAGRDAGGNRRNKVGAEIRHAAARSVGRFVEALEQRQLLSIVTPSHIVVVVEEDRAANAIGDVTNMPYFNQLASEGLVYSNSHGLNTPTQEGEMNYLALFSGSTQGETGDGFNGPYTGKNLSQSLFNKGLTFSGYAEAMPCAGDTTDAYGASPTNPAYQDLYMGAYNPMAQFSNVGTGVTNAQMNQTFASFPTTAAGYAALPTVSYVIPDTLDNTHGSNETNPYATDPSQYNYLRQNADAWLKNNLSGYVQWAEQNNSILIITGDEGDRTHGFTSLATNDITTIVVGDPRIVVPGVDNTSITPYNILRTIEDMYGLTPIGNTTSAADLDVNAQGQLAAPTAQAPTSIAIAASANPTVFGQSVTFTATVTGSGSPTGTVEFEDGTTLLGTSTLNGSGVATFTTSALSVGVHSMNAEYLGGTNFQPSNSTVLADTVNKAATTTAVTSSVSPSAFGQGVIFTATVAPIAPGAGTPTGAVQFTIDGSNFGAPVALSAGTATSPSIATLSASSHQVAAIYIGDTNFVASTAIGITQVVTAAPTPTVNYASGFAGETGLQLNGSAAISGSALRLTNGGSYQDASAFSSSTVNVSTFTTSFDFQLTAGANIGHGFTFTIQGEGPTALGQSGGGLGYGNDYETGAAVITNSVAVKFDLYSNEGEGNNSTGLFTDGANPTLNASNSDLTPSGLNLHSGDKMNVAMTYDGTTLTVTIKDTVTGASATQAYVINIPTTVGGTSAYVGFTAGTGGLTSTQSILDWTFSSSSSAQLPAAPSGLTGTASATSANLTWTNNATGITAYQLDRATDAAFTQNVVTQTLPASPASYTDTALTAGTTYYYRVRAVNTAGASGNSNTASVAIAAQLPTAPSALTATASGTSVNLAWTNTNTGLTGYQLDRATDAAFTQNVVSQTLPASPASYTDTGLAAGTTYYYRVRAVNSAGASGNSNTASVAIAVQPPSAPSGLTATASGMSVNLTWTNNATGITGYQLDRATDAAFTQNVVTQTLPSSPSSYTDTGLTGGTIYYYRLRAVNTAAASGNSNTAVVTAGTNTPTVNYAVGFAGEMGLQLNGSAAVSGSALQLTNGGSYQAGSAFTSTAVNVAKFTTSFDFQLTAGANTGHGFTLTIQDQGPTALGQSGGGLGYGNDYETGAAVVTKSVAVKFDLYSNEGEGNNSTGLFTNGANPTLNASNSDLTPSGVNLHSGDEMNVQMSYNGTTLTVTIKDTVTGATATQSYVVNIPATVGGSTAYVGFTAGTGGLTATQSILDWTFSNS